MIASESEKRVPSVVVHKGFRVGTSYSMSPITPPWQTTQSVGSPSDYRDHQPCVVRSDRSRSDAATRAQEERSLLPSEKNPAALTTADDWRRALVCAWLRDAAKARKHNPTEGVVASVPSAPVEPPASAPSTPVRHPASGRTTTPKTPGIGALGGDNYADSDSEEDDALQFPMED